MYYPPVLIHQSLSHSQKTYSMISRSSSNSQQQQTTKTVTSQDQTQKKQKEQPSTSDEKRKRNKFSPHHHHQQQQQQYQNLPSQSQIITHSIHCPQPASPERQTKKQNLSGGGRAPEKAFHSHPSTNPTIPSFATITTPTEQSRAK